ncbi:hypothetical protein Plhal710r2_c017g0076731 [Plasmopara halstedii]
MYSVREILLTKLLEPGTDMFNKKFTTVDSSKIKSIIGNLTDEKLYGKTQGKIKTASKSKIIK